MLTDLFPVESRATWTTSLPNWCSQGLTLKGRRWISDRMEGWMDLDFLGETAYGQAACF